ncbi:MAG: hypothetical protein K0B07_05135 [DPANN group archaeon]|nr:hypothetical protein [DPANN group archaeon]
MRRIGRLDMAIAVTVILAIVLIAIIGMAVFDVFDSGENEADGMFDALKCQPKIAQACMDGKISETTDINEVDGKCITNANKATICDNI